MPKQRYYVIWKGRKTGIFTSWSECEEQVKGFTGAKYKAFESHQAAEAAFRGNYQDYHGRAAMTQQWLFAPVKPILPSLSVDAACSGAPGPLEYRGVNTETGQQIFRAGPFADGTNNIGEFLAIVDGLKWIMDKKLEWPIYSDSENAIGWVKAGKCRTKLERKKSNTKLFNLINTAELWLSHNRNNQKILKWDTQAWGEIPADFNRK